MKKLNTQQALKNFQGKDIVEGKTTVTVGLLLSNILANTTQNPQRAYILGQAIAKEKEVELKAEDIVFLKGILSATQTIGALYTGQLIEILDN